MNSQIYATRLFDVFFINYFELKIKHSFAITIDH
jgi:hypothetical protein